MDKFDRRKYYKTVQFGVSREGRAGPKVFAERKGLGRILISGDDVIVCNCEGTSIAIRQCLHLLSETSRDSTNEGMHESAIRNCALNGLVRIGNILAGKSIDNKK